MLFSVTQIVTVAAVNLKRDDVCVASFFDAVTIMAVAVVVVAVEL